jgi:ankyrin repeat protein
MKNVLHQAAAHGDVDVIRRLLAYDLDVNLTDADGNTALNVAIGEEHHECAIALIRGGADVNVNAGGIFSNPLHVAIIRQNVELVEALLEAGAKLNMTDQFGNSALHLLMNIFNKGVHSCRRIFDLLVAKRIDLNQSNYNQWCPLHIAVRNGQYDAVKASLKHNLKQLSGTPNPGVNVFDLNI